MATSPEVVAQIKGLNDKIGALKEEKAELESEIETLKTEKNEDGKIIDKLRKDLANKDIEITTAHDERDNAKAELTTARENHAKEKENLESKMKTKRDELSSEIRTLKAKIKENETEMESSKSSLTQMTYRHGEELRRAERYKGYLEDYKIDYTTGIMEESETHGGDINMRAMMSMMKTLERMNASRKVEPPCFKGNSGEKPEPHLLKCEDYFAESGIKRDTDKTTSFKTTLEGKAREWYEDIDVPASWTDLKQMFRSHYSVQGRSIQELHERWRSFRFDPSTMDIDAYISDVKQTGSQLNYNDAAILSTLKASVPREVFYILFEKDDLKQVIKVLKNYYSKKVSDDPPSTQPSPFSNLAALPTSPKSVSFEPMSELENKLSRQGDQLKTILNRLDDRDNYRSRDRRPSQRRPPFKPFISRGYSRDRYRSQSRDRYRSQSRDGYRSQSRDGYRSQSRDGYRPQSRDRYRNNDQRYHSDDNGYYQNNGPRSYRGRGHGDNNRNRSVTPTRNRSRGRYDKSPVNRKPKTASKTIDKDKALRCHKCNEIGHWANECQNMAGHNNMYDHDALYDTESFTFGSAPDTTAEDEKEFENFFNLNKDEDFLSLEAHEALQDNTIDGQWVMKMEEQDQGQFMPLN